MRHTAARDLVVLSEARAAHAEALEHNDDALFWCTLHAYILKEEVRHVKIK